MGVHGLQRFKASKTLLGIETGFIGAMTSAADGGFKASKTLLGIETQRVWKSHWTNKRFKASKTLLGIETRSKLLTWLTDG